MAITIDCGTAQTAHDLINVLKDAIAALPESPEKDVATEAERQLHAFAHEEFIAAGGEYRLPGEAARGENTGPVIYSNNTGNKGAGGGGKP